MSFLTPFFLARPRRDRDSGPDPPDSARAEARRRVPVADVRAADSVPVGAAAAHPPLAAAADARGGDRADRRRVRAAVLAAGRGRRGGRRRRARGRHPARSVGEHGLRRSLDRARRTPRARVVRGIGADDRATLVLFGRNAEENMRATSDRARLEARDRRGEGRLRRDALRPGAEARGEHPQPIADQAARGGADQRLPEQRLERIRGRALSRGHDAQPVSVGVARHGEPRGAVGRVRALVVLRPGTRSRSPPASATRATRRSRTSRSR